MNEYMADMKEKHQNKILQLNTENSQKLQIAHAKLQAFEQSCEFEKVLETYNN